MDPRMLGMFGNAFPDGLPGWETVVGVLQHVQSAPNAAVAASGMCGVEVAVNMSANQPLSQAAWKKLIQNDKVPQKIAACCCLSDDPYQQRTSALAALSALLDRLIDDGILDAALCRQTPLTALLQQQFEAELLPNLPTLMVITSDALNSAAAAGSNGGSSGSNCGSRNGSSAGYRRFEETYNLLARANHLLHVYYKIRHVWPMGVFTSDAAAAAAAPACELSLAIVRVVPGCVQRTCQPPPPPLHVLMPLNKSLFALHQALVLRFEGRMIGGERLQNLAMSLTDMELQQHPCYLPSLALLLLLNGYAVLANQHKSLPGFDSSSGGSSGSSNGAAPAAAAAPTRGGSSGGGSDGSSSKSGSRSGGGVASAPKPSAASATAGGAAAGAAPAGSSLQGAAPGKKGLRGGFFGSSSSGAKKSSSSLGSAAAPAARDGATASAGSKTPSAAAAAAAAKPKQGRTAAGPAGSTAAASSSSSTPSQSEQWEDAQAARMVQMLYPDLRQKGTYAWQQAHKMLPGLPYSHRQLLQLCELDPEVVLWCGYYRMQAAVPANFLGVLTMVRANVSFFQQDDQRKLRSPQHDAILQQQLVGMSLFGLYWSAHHPFTDASALNACENAVLLAVDVLRSWMMPPQLADHLRPQQQQQRQQQDEILFEAKCTGAFGQLGIVQEVLPLLPPVLTRLLAAMQWHVDSTVNSNGAHQATFAAMRSGTKGGATSEELKELMSCWTSNSKVPGAMESRPTGMHTLMRLVSVMLGAAGGWLVPDIAPGLSTSREQHGSAAVKTATAAGGVAGCSAGEGVERLMVHQAAARLWGQQHALPVLEQLQHFVRAAASGYALPVPWLHATEPPNNSTGQGQGSALLASSILQKPKDASVVMEQVLDSIAAMCVHPVCRKSGVLHWIASEAGPGSKQQLKLLGLLCSLLKCHTAAASFEARYPTGQGKHDSSGSSSSSAPSGTWRTGQKLALGALGQSSRPADKLAVTVHCARLLVAEAAVAALEEVPGAQAVATAVLPWLVLFGRCCLLWGSQLRGKTAAELCEPLADPSMEGRGVYVFHKSEKDQPLIEMQGFFEAWLRCASVGRKLAAAGYVTEPLVKHFAAAVAALKAVWAQAAGAPAVAAAGGDGGEERMEVFANCMQQLGSELCLLAVPELCNNPACGNVSGPSEARLVSGKGCLCGGCRVARYCSRDCQRAVWKQHKPVCKALAAAAEQQQAAGGS